MESDGGLRHLAFFEELGKMEDSDAGWHAVSAGLVTMRLVDRWIAVGSTSKLDSWSVSAVREAIAQVSDGTPIRRILTSVVDVMVACTATDMHALSPRLMAYGQALEYDAKWALAADVYGTVSSHTHPSEDADMSVSASLQLGFCLKTLGRFDEAKQAYGSASQVAMNSNDVPGVLRGRIGVAKIAADRGNMPAAEEILDAVIAQSNDAGLDDVRSRALTDRAFVAGSRGEHSRAIRFSYEALVLAKSPRTRDRILTNIATGFKYLGNSKVAKEAYLVLAATAQEQFIRWNSILNLLDIAAREGNELQFDRYRRDLESADLSPQLRANFYLFAGRGYSSLGHFDAAIEYLESAISFAMERALNQTSFEADAALADAKRQKRTMPSHSVFDANSVELDDVALAIGELAQSGCT